LKGLKSRRSVVTPTLDRGGMVSFKPIINCVYIVGLHVMFYATYMDNHPMMAKMGGNMPMHNHPRLGMILTGPLVGIALGLVQGLFAWLASKIIKRPEVAA